MKRYFIETNGYNMVAYVGSDNRAFIITDSTDNDLLTLEAAKNGDYSEIDGMTIDEMNASIGSSNNFIVDDFDINGEDYENVTEF